MPKHDEKKPVSDKQPNDAPEPMDPEVEAKRSGPPPAADAREMPGIQPAAPTPQPVSEAEGDRNSAMVDMIDEMLKDPDFDTSGRYRVRLAELSRSLPGKRYPATTDVDTHGDPEGEEPER